MPFEPYPLVPTEAWLGIKPQEPKAARSRLRLLTPADCENAPSREYVVKGLLSEGDVACVFGPPGAGKSVLVPHIAYAVAQGRRAFGRRTKPGHVLYLAAEDALGMRRRVHALKLRHGDAPSFALLEGAGSLLDKPELDALLDVVAEQMPALIVLDTLAAAFPGFDENSAPDMGRVVKSARELAELGAAVVLIHHDTKAGTGTPRGHSILNGALDVAILLGRTSDGTIGGTLTKNRNGPAGNAIAFTIQTIEVGEDADGDVINAPTATEIANDGQRTTKPPRSEAGALAVFRELLAESPHRSPNGELAVLESDWRAACDDRRVVSTAEAAKSRATAFRRAFDRLVSGKTITAGGGLVWLTVPPFGDLSSFVARTKERAIHTTGAAAPAPAG